jgi:hypothetical protein
LLKLVTRAGMKLLPIIFVPVAVFGGGGRAMQRAAIGAPLPLVLLVVNMLIVVGVELIQLHCVV